MKKYLLKVFLILFSSIIFLIGCPPPDDYAPLVTIRPATSPTPFPTQTPFPTSAPTLGPINENISVSVLNLRNYSYVYSRRIFGTASGDGIDKILIRIDYGEIYEINGKYDWYYDLPEGNSSWKYMSKHVIEVFAKDTDGLYSVPQTLFLTTGINRDINGDGYSDVVTGTPDYDNGQIDEGRVYIFYGSSDGPANTPSVILEIDVEQAGFGYSIAFAGDVNGDGFGDLIIGAPNYDTGDSVPGAVFLYYGSEDGITVTEPDWEAYGELDDDFFGCSVACAGHVNDDGYADLIIGAMDADIDTRQEILVDAGKAYIFYGTNEEMSQSPDLILMGSKQANAKFGTSVSTAGDMDATDGYSDVIIGEPYYNADRENQGRIVLYWTNNEGILVNDNYATIDIENSFFGMSVCYLGDLTYNGNSHVLVAAPGFNTNSGKVQILSYCHLMDHYRPKVGESYYTKIGSSISTAGNINGDEHSDIIIGAADYTSNQNNINDGAVFIYLGSDTVIFETDPWIKTGDQSYAQMGYGQEGLSSVGTAGDVNGDGFSDVIFAAPYYDTGGGSNLDAGIVYVYYGTNDDKGINGSNPWSYPGDQENGYLGLSVAK